MRTLLLVLGLACVFGLAALWHADRISEAKADQERARRLAKGEITQTEVGDIREGYGVLVVGKPAPAANTQNSSSISAPNPPSTSPTGGTKPGADAPRPDAAPKGSDAAADFSLVVQTGASLGKIAKAHYGTANAELVKALARYNKLASPDALQVGQKLALPPIEKLEAAHENSR